MHAIIKLGYILSISVKLQIITYRIALVKINCVVVATEHKKATLGNV